MLVDEFLPEYDVSDAVATVVDADLLTTWDALMEVDLIDVGRRRPLVGILGAMRILPEIVSHMLHGEPPQRPPEHLRLRDLTQLPLDKGEWVLLGERPRDEIALGLVGKFWRPVIEFAFRRYWTFGVGSGAHILVNGLLDVTREIAEARARIPESG